VWGPQAAILMTMRISLVPLRELAPLGDRSPRYLILAEFERNRIINDRLRLLRQRIELRTNLARSLLLKSSAYWGLGALWFLKSRAHYNRKIDLGPVIGA